MRVLAFARLLHVALLDLGLGRLDELVALVLLLLEPRLGIVQVDDDVEIQGKKTAIVRKSGQTTRARAQTHAYMHTHETHRLARAPKRTTMN